MRLQDKVILVTNSSGGIGKSVALACAKEGAKVIVHGRNKAQIETVADQIRAMGQQTLGIPAEISEHKQVTSLIQQVLDRFSRIDVLINNDGNHIDPRKLEDTPEEIWDETIATLLYGPYYFCREVIPIMQRHGGGKIINITSDTADFQSIPNTTSLPYVSAKSALRGMTRQLAWLYGQDDITVNTISLGDFLTAKKEKWWYSLQEKERQHILSNSALERLGQPDDVTGAAIFFASADSDYITGATLHINGGRFMS